MLARIASITQDSIVDGPGLRMAVFVQGCHHHCPGCHNPQTHDPDAGQAMEIDAILDKATTNPLIDGVTITGGEPFDQAPAMAELARKVHEKGLNVVTYTGYLFEDLYEGGQPGWHQLLAETDLLIDGPFLADKRSLALQFRGSSNQRMLDGKSSFSRGEAVPADMHLWLGEWA